MKKTGIFITLAAFFFASCKSTRNIQTAIAKKDSSTVMVPVIPTNNPKQDTIAFIRDNYKKIMDSRISVTAFSAKVDVDYTDGEGKRINVNAHIRMYKDSVIWVSVTGPLGIEGVRAYITKDSVKVLNKQDKVYITRSVSYLQEITELPLDLHSLQNLILGNPVFLDSTIVSYSRSAGSISLQSNGKFFKNLLTISDPDRLLQASKLDDKDELRNRTCYLTYSDYENKKGFNFPSKRTINISEKKKLDIKLNFKQYEFNETLSFPFNVPKNYKRD